VSNTVNVLSWSLLKQNTIAFWLVGVKFYPRVLGIFFASGFPASVGLSVVITGLFAGFLISLAIFPYLMRASVRLFFRFVDEIE